MMDKMIRVTMFHTFSITYLDHSINGDSMKSEKLVRLLCIVVYLAYFCINFIVN